MGQVGTWFSKHCHDRLEMIELPIIVSIKQRDDLCASLGNGGVARRGESSIVRVPLETDMLRNVPGKLPYKLLGTILRSVLNDDQFPPTKRLLTDGLQGFWKVSLG